MRLARSLTSSALGAALIAAVIATPALGQGWRPPPAPNPPPSLDLQTVEQSRGNVRRGIFARSYSGYFAVFGDRPGIIVGSFNPRLNQVQGTYIAPYTVCSGALPRVTVTPDTATYLAPSYTMKLEELDKMLAPIETREMVPEEAPSAPPSVEKREEDHGVAVVGCLIKDGGERLCGVVAEEPTGLDYGKQALAAMQEVALSQGPGECVVTVMRFRE